MTYKHIGFSDSIVMRELERQARAKNPVQDDSNEREMLKIASKVESKPKQIVLTASSATGDIFSDVILVAEALRNRGFVTQADNLEAKAILYKKAYNDTERPERDEHQDVAKYKFWSEQGKDVIDAAHQVDNFDEIKTLLGEGYFKNINEVQERMLAATKSEPTGNYQKTAATKKKAKDLVVLALSAIDDRIAKVAQATGLDDAGQNSTVNPYTQKLKADTEALKVKAASLSEHVNNMVSLTKTIAVTNYDRKYANNIDNICKLATHTMVTIPSTSYKIVIANEKILTDFLKVDANTFRTANYPILPQLGINVFPENKNYSIEESNALIAAAKQKVQGLFNAAAEEEGKLRTKIDNLMKQYQTTYPQYDSLYSYTGTINETLKKPELKSDDLLSILSTAASLRTRIQQLFNDRLIAKLDNIANLGASLGATKHFDSATIVNERKASEAAISEVEASAKGFDTEFSEPISKYKELTNLKGIASGLAAKFQSILDQNSKAVHEKGLNENILTNINFYNKLSQVLSGLGNDASVMQLLAAYNSIDPGGGAKNVKDLISQINKGLASPGNLENALKQASTKFDLTKVAVPNNPWDNQTATPAKTPSRNNGSGGGTYTAPAQKLSPELQAAVTEMHTDFTRLSGAIEKKLGGDAAAIPRNWGEFVSPLTQGGMDMKGEDHVWGKKTQAALNAVSQMASQCKEYGVDAKMVTSQPPAKNETPANIMQRIDNNIKVMHIIMGLKLGSGEHARTVYQSLALDYIPTSTSELSNASENMNGGIPINRDVLGNLLTLRKYLVARKFYI